ncbi:MAG: LemA family protein [Oscillospiraceae bacterium]|nr:LemA family protein [Oscillospiraceae bacterium]
MGNIGSIILMSNIKPNFTSTYSTFTGRMTATGVTEFLAGVPAFAFVIAAVVLIVLIWWIAKRNGFVRLRNRVTEAASGIEVALTKRFDMLTKMVDVAKGYMTHERETIFEVINLRRGMTIDEMSEANAKMDANEARINVVAENYPQLRSSDVFVSLQAGIRDAEEHLQAARRLYNATATAFNNAIQVFPASIVAGLGGFKPVHYFAAEDHKKEDVKMQF